MLIVSPGDISGFPREIDEKTVDQLQTYDGVYKSIVVDKADRYRNTPGKMPRKAR